ncbi:MAG: SDR family NAD(P)-dependent oxidoreductase, partial [Leptospiraceae bacterium]|nr:SDR family NAD(P)-dependent oxidoreductase [Leptospiraceae bacterium]
MKKVLILGGTSDIGKHIVYGFGKRGYDIIVTGRDNKRLNEIKEYTIKNYNIKIQDYILDVEKFNSHEDFLNSLDDLPEITVCCFGYYEDQDEAFNKFEEALRTINVNYSGAVSLINRISKRYMEKKNGS